MNKYKVSVIIPAYNPGTLIIRCVDSICNQTLKELEIIVIDDCSNDGSIEKIKEKATLDNRIKVITNENNIGAGPSRNKGIEVSKGEYLSFIDADDYVERDYYELLYKKAKDNNLDIVKGTIIHEKNKKEIITGRRKLNEDIQRDIKNKPLFLSYTYQHHCSLYRREMIINNKLTYGKSKRAQDVTFLLKVCLEARSFDFEERAKYHFCEYENSAMHQMDEASLKGLIESLQEQIEYLLEKRVEGKYADAYITTKATQLIREYYRFTRDQIDKQEWFIDELINILKHYPAYERLKEKSFSIKALLDYKAILPTVPHFLPWEKEKPEAWLELIKIWIDFLDDHNDLEAENIYKLGGMVGNAKRWGAKNKDINKILNKLSVFTQVRIKTHGLLSSKLSKNTKRYIKSIYNNITN